MQYETKTNIVDGQTEHCRVTVLFFFFKKICTTRPKHCVRLVCNGNLRFTIEGEKARGAGEMYLMLLCWRCHADLVGSDILQSSLTHHTHFILPNLSLQGGSHCGIRECQKRNKVRGAYLRKDNFPRRQLFFFLSLGLGSLWSSSLFQFASGAWQGHATHARWRTSLRFKAHTVA